MTKIEFIQIISVKFDTDREFHVYPTVPSSFLVIFRNWWTDSWGRN